MVLLILSGAFILSPVKAEGVTLTSQAGKVTVSSGKLNVRKSASSASSVVSTLSGGSYVTLISQSGSWWYVEYADGKFGYCHSSYISPVYGNAKLVSTSSGNLNVRKGGGTGYGVKDSLSSGEAVIVLWTTGDWSYILYDGNELGFVSSKYLVSGSVSYPKISLSVPDFKQTDSRWASVTLGSSGKTIGSVGCTTTGIAMMESYRAGYNIYPGTMAKKLSYTSSGSVYWPSDYKAVTESSGYLSKIYEILSSGKPVLIGAKNSSGSQHWVVVTGYSGGNTLTASGFTINDPGSSSRVTLQQFLSSYPNFYKFYYY